MPPRLIGSTCIAYQVHAPNFAMCRSKIDTVNHQDSSLLVYSNSLCMKHYGEILHEILSVR